MKFGKIPVEGTEWQMPRFPGNFQNEAIGETQRGTGAETIQRQCNDI